MIRVQNEVTCYAVDGEEVRPGEWGHVWLTVCSSPPPSRLHRVVLGFIGTTVTVLASDLRAAIDNAVNAGET